MAVLAAALGYAIASQLGVTSWLVLLPILSTPVLLDVARRSYEKVVK